MALILTFRPANTSDLAQVQALVNSAYRGESSQQGWTSEAHFLGGQRTDAVKLAEYLGPDEQGHLQRLELGFAPTSELRACMYLRRELDEQGVKTAYVGLLTVDPRHQAEGLGKQLLLHAERVAHEWGCKDIRMTVVHLRGELIAYYERRGYSLTGVVEEFPMDDPRFGIPLVTDLRLLEMKKTL